MMCKENLSTLYGCMNNPDGTLKRQAVNSGSEAAAQAIYYGACMEQVGVEKVPEDPDFAECQE